MELPYTSFRSACNSSMSECDIMLCRSASEKGYTQHTHGPLITPLKLMGEGSANFLDKKGYSNKVNPIHVKLHVATTWFELPFCPSVYLLHEIFV